MIPSFTASEVDVVLGFFCDLLDVCWSDFGKLPTPGKRYFAFTQFIFVQ